VYPHLGVLKGVGDTGLELGIELATALLSDKF
jgi:hypothetical protein